MGYDFYMRILSLIISSLYVVILEVNQLCVQVLDKMIGHKFDYIANF